MAANFEGREHDGTAAMANAFFGTPGCEGAIDRVFGVRKAPKPEEGKTDNQVQASVPKIQDPLFEIPSHGYVVDLRQVQGVGIIYHSSGSLFPVYGFDIDLKGVPLSKPIKWLDENPKIAEGHAERAREALLKAWYDYTKEGA